MRSQTLVAIGCGLVGSIIICVMVLSTQMLQPLAPVFEHGSVAVIMCPACETQFLSVIRGGGDIDCALYNFGKTTETTLKAARARVLTDDQDGAKFGKPIAQDGLMHNKFCIINNSVVMTGSYNPTENGELSRNNLVVITSPTLAANYRAEFQAISSGGSRKRITHHVTLDGIGIENAFCPRDDCESRVILALQQAKEEIVYFTYTFTSEGVAATLEQARAAGIRVTGVCDGGQWNVQGSKCTRVKALSWDQKHIMHHKVFIIDGKTVVTGSYNPTKAGTSRNSENIIILTDTTIASQYLAEFERVLAESTSRGKP